MIKTTRIIGIAILLFFAIKICNRESAPPVDYNKYVTIGLNYIEHSYDDTYKLTINFRNNRNHNLTYISAEFVFASIVGNEIARLKRKILPDGYSLAPDASYPYKLYFQVGEEPFLKSVNILYAE